MIDSVGTVRKALDRGLTLPASWYFEPEIAALERERIFTRAWQYAGPAELVAEPGSFLASRAGHIPAVVTRDQEGELHALVNVCRHRGHLVASGHGCRETLQCPYHAWTYQLDGRLRRAPRSEREPGFDPDEWGLLAMAVDSWGPFVFVNPDPEAGPLADHLGKLPDVIARSGLDVGALRFRRHTDWDLPANWKVSIENYLECYHCPVAHPSFSRLYDVDPDAYLLEAQATFSSQFGPVRPAALEGRGAPYDARGPVREAQYHFLWPNTTINIDAGPPNLSIDRWLPDGPGNTLGASDFYYAEDVPEETARAMMAFYTEVANEDRELVLNVQAGLASGMVPNGRRLESSEHLIGHFQRLVADALAG
jgi:choline monooxygenase